MKKILLSAFALTMLTFATKAQEKIGFQARVGVNFTNMNGKSDGDKENEKMKTGFHVGVDAAIPLAPDFYLQPGVLFSQKGSKSKANSDFKTNLSYIEVPVTFMYKPALGDGKLILGVGPYFGYAIGGKFKTPDADVDIEFGSGDDDMLKPFDFGGNLNFGYEFTSKIFAQANVQLGMANLVPKGDSDNSIKNTGFGISLGYKF